MSLGHLLHNVNVSDAQLEANLSTMLQCVRGTKHFWSLKRSDLQCIMHEAGSPTLFLTFSCTECQSTDIHAYLKTVNDVPEKYNMSTLCTEDPISLSRQFSQKFHAFFQQVLVKGEVLGKVDHYIWKKEYQAHGAPHYHLLLWIEGAPVIGRDSPDKVLAWIQERITCHIHKLSFAQMHQLLQESKAWQCLCHKVQILGFLCHPLKLPSCTVWKKGLKNYELPHMEAEVRVSDYNPLLLLL